jgi:hypothetical protein
LLKESANLQTLLSNTENSAVSETVAA